VSVAVVELPAARAISRGGRNVATLAGLGLCAATASARQVPIDLISLNSSGAQANWHCSSPAIATDGRVVAFVTAASNLSAVDNNGQPDVYVRDLLTGATTLASVDANGNVGYWDAYVPSISGNGRFVVFQTLNSLVSSDAGFNDVYMRDLRTATTVRVSQPPSGSQPDGDSYPGMISVDGQWVAFLSYATNFVALDSNGFAWDVFVWERATGAITLEHRDSAGVQGNSSCFGVSISANGRYIAFSSDADNLVPGDTNSSRDIFLRDRWMGTTVRVSVDSQGNQANGPSHLGGVGDTHRAISDDGQCVIFESEATNLVPGDTNLSSDIFCHDLGTGTTKRVNVGTAGLQANLYSSTYSYHISGDGRFIAFETTANNLVPGETTFSRDVYIHDRSTSETRWLSSTVLGLSGNGDSVDSSISPDGQFVAFASIANNLVSNDHSQFADIFFVALDQWGPVGYCASQLNSAGCVPRIRFSGYPSVSAGSGFTIRGEPMLSTRNGLLCYGISGPDSVPFQGGTLCARPPLRRTALQNSGGVGPCGGLFQVDFASYVASGVDLSLIPGQGVWAQWYSRDPASLSTTNLTDALYFVLRP
jgi:Tol biopolymer transport system component